MRARHQFILTEGQLASLKEHGIINQVVLKQTSTWTPGDHASCELDWDRAEVEGTSSLYYLRVPYTRRGKGGTVRIGNLIPRWGVGDFLEAYTPGRDYDGDYTPDRDYEATLEVVSVVPKRTEYGWDWVISTKEVVE